MESTKKEKASAPRVGRPDVVHVSEVTSRSKFTRKVVVEESFSESQIRIVTPAASEATASGSSGSQTTAADERTSNPCSGSCHADTVSARRTTSDTEEDAEDSGAEDRSAPAVSGGRRRTSAAEECDPPKKFKATVTKVNNALRTTNLEELHRQTSSNISFRPRRKSFSFDGLREIQTSTIDSWLLYGILKPLFVAMNLAGILYVKPTEGDHVTGSRSTNISGQIRNRSRARSRLHLAYCCLVGLVYLTNFVLSFWALCSIENFQLSFKTTFTLTWCVIWLESSLRSVACLVTASSDDRNLKVLLGQMENVCYKDHIVPYEQRLTKFTRIMFSLSCVGTLGATAINMYALFFDEMLGTLLEALWPGSKRVPDPVGYVFFRIFILASVTLSKAGCLLMTSLFSVVTYVLYTEFVLFGRSLSAKITPDGDFPCDLEKFRLNHEARCKLVEATNGIFKYYLTVIYMTNTPPLCLLAYSLIESGLPLVYKLYGLYWLLWFLVQLGVVSTMAIKVNTQAHAPLACIHGLKARCVTAERQMEISVFMNRLTGTCIGLTACDLFTINKPTMLTILGMILTYFFLLVQFRNPLTGDSNSTTTCRCILNITTGNISKEL